MSDHVHLAGHGFVASRHSNTSPDYDSAPGQDLALTDAQRQSQTAMMLQGFTSLEELGTARSNFANVLRTMKNTRKERVAIKSDCNLLENRIKILKLEEQRAWARIQKSRERAKKILLIRQQQAYNKDRKAADADYERRMKRAHVMNLQKHRELVRAQISANREKAKIQKQREVQMLKDEKARAQEEIEAERLAALKRAKGQNARIRDEAIIRRERLAARKAEKLAEVQREYEERLRKEEEQRREEERHLKKLEEEELELIERLQNTQQFATLSNQIFEVPAIEDGK